MLEQLKELLEMQRVLDDAILKEHGNVYDKKIAEQMKIALFVELGELMNELPSYFKHWKKTAKDNREKALVEYVDCLHFQLSLMNYYEIKSVDVLHNYYDCDFESDVKILSLLRYCINDCDCNLGLHQLFVLGNKLGFTWEEIYSAYKKKNAVNYERLRNNY